MPAHAAFITKVDLQSNVLTMRKSTGKICKNLYHENFRVCMYVLDWTCIDLLNMNLQGSFEQYTAFIFNNFSEVIEPSRICVTCVYILYYLMTSLHTIFNVYIFHPQVSLVLMHGQNYKESLTTQSACIDATMRTATIIIKCPKISMKTHM